MNKVEKSNSLPRLLLRREYISCLLRSLEILIWKVINYIGIKFWRKCLSSQWSGNSQQIFNILFAVFLMQSALLIPRQFLKLDTFTGNWRGWDSAAKGKIITVFKGGCVVSHEGKYKLLAAGERNTNWS